MTNEEVDNAGERAVLLICLYIYIALLLKITVVRSGFFPNGLAVRGNVNLLFLTGYSKLLLNKKCFSFIYLFGGNVLWFLPFGCMVPVLDRKRYTELQTVWRGFCLSLAIETAQFILGTGVAEIDDLFLNTIGTAAGFLLLKRIAGQAESRL